MKTLIYFNAPDKPKNMGISQLTYNVQDFLAERSDVLINSTITDNILDFENPDGIKGYAVMMEVPEDFEN